MITCLTDQTEDAGTNCMFTIPDYTALVTATDACGTVTVTQNPPLGTMVGLGDTTVTITADDGTLTTPCVFILTVEDNTPIDLVCPPTQNETADISNMFTLLDYTTLATATDNCGTPTLSQSPAPGAVVGLGTTVVTITATSGIETITCMFDVVVNSATAPNIICPADQIEDASATCEFIVPDYTTSATVTNGSGTGTITQMPTAGTIVNSGVTTVTLNLTDGAFTDSCNFSLTVNDVTPPMITCLTDQTETASATCDFVIPDYASLIVATDSCSPTVTVTQDPIAGTLATVGTTVITISATDGTNTDTCTFNLSVQETTPPTAVCQDITVFLDAMGMAVITPAEVDGGSFDNCGNVTTTININTFDCSNVGENEVILTVTDASGLSTTCTAIVTVEDNEAPIVNCQNITIELNENGIATITTTDVDGGSSDACGITSTEIDIDTFDCSNLGDNNVTLTVTDINGNQTSCIAIVTVTGTTGTPVAVCQNLTVPLGADGTATINASALNGGSSGTSCPDSYTISIDTFTCEDIGTPVQVLFTVTNALGESDSCVALVNVVDTLAPEVFCPDDQTVISTGPYILPDYFATGEAMAIDNCTDPVTVFDQEPNPGTPLEQGTYTITLSAQDSNGFENECTFELSVNDTLGTIDIQPSIATVLLYPNPASGFIRISNPQSIQLEKLTIYDLNGRVVLTEILSNIESSAIDVSLLQSATYLVTIDGDAGQITKRLIIE